MGDVVIGAGMGGLCAAITLAREGRSVTVIEARDTTGGLAGRLELEGQGWDPGPYILLDKNGLEWVFRQLGADLHALVDLIELDEVYRVRGPDRPDVAIYRSLDRTAGALEDQTPGAADKYRDWIARMGHTYERLRPLQSEPRPGPWKLIRRGLLREAAFLLRGLEHHVRSSELPEHVTDTLGIWTHIAGQPLSKAPAPLAFVPAIIHEHGAYVARGGIHQIPMALERLARAVGVQFRMGQRVRRIVRDGRRILGVEVDDERIDADRVFSNAAGVGTYVNLLHPPEPALSASLKALPLQSPGVAAYLEVPEDTAVPFLQFWVRPGEKAQMLVHPGIADPTRRGRARLVSPLDHSWADSVGEEGQNGRLDTLLAADWWKDGVAEHRVLHRRIPKDWGTGYHLYRDSMNPVMTAQFMRRGRLPHRSPVADNLFLVGSATHPGQWVSFCAISGVLAARASL